MTRKIYCPLCSGEIVRSSLQFECLKAGRRLDPALGHSLHRAVHSVDAPAEVSEAGAVEYLCCPNCKTELDEYDDRERRLQCPRCGLRLSTRDQLALMEARAHHDPNEDA